MTSSKHTKILMPALSPTMENGKLVKWNIKIGDKIQPGDYIADVETDKAVIEMESMHKGIVSDLIDEGTAGLLVGALIGVLIPSSDSAAVKISDIKDINKTSIDKVKNNDSSHDKHNDNHNVNATNTNDVNTTVNANVVNTNNDKDSNAILEAQNNTKKSQNALHNYAKQPNTMGDRIFVTPIAKKIAYQNNVDLNYVSGSGPRGRIRKADILAIGMGSKEQDMHRLQGLIADRMVHTKKNVPHFYMEKQINAEHIIKLKESISKRSKVTINDIFIKIVAHAIADLPHINVNYVDGNRVKYRNTVDVGFVVGIAEGVLTPVVNNADKISIFDIAKITKEKISSIKAGDYTVSTSDGSVTISNMGMFGIDRFYAVLNQPMPFIVAIGGLVDSFKVNNGNIETFKAINITISADHRVINGVEAGNFINKIQEFAHEPVRILI